MERLSLLSRQRDLTRSLSLREKTGEGKDESYPFLFRSLPDSETYESPLSPADCRYFGLSLTFPLTPTLSHASSYRQDVRRARDAKKERRKVLESWEKNLV